MRRKGNPKSPKTPAQKDLKPSQTSQDTSESDHKLNKLIIISSIVLLSATAFAGYAIWSYLNVPSKNQYLVKVLEDVKATLKDFDRQAQALPLLNKVLRALQNETTHDALVFAIENTSFIPFVSTHMAEVAAYCTAGFSKQLLLESLKFLAGYVEHEKKPLCIVAEPLQALFRCPGAPDVAAEVRNYVSTVSKAAGEDCEREFLTAFCNLATFSQSIPAAKHTAWFAANAPNQVVADKKTKVCEVVAMLTKEGQEVADDTRREICAIAEKVECSAFRTMNMDEFCPK